MLNVVFFAGFFMDVPKLESDWYGNQDGWFAVTSRTLLAAFAMIPILSDYSCRCKADCIHARAAQGGFFFAHRSHTSAQSLRFPRPPLHVTSYLGDALLRDLDTSAAGR